MTTYIGFSTVSNDQQKTTVFNSEGKVIQPTIQKTKKFRITDRSLIIQDLVNAFNIEQGQKVGQPEYGTLIWSFIFAPNTTDTHQDVIAEVRRVIAQDARITTNNVSAFMQDHGMLIEVDLTITTDNSPFILSLFFDTISKKVSVK